jgi:hypothetical protein
MRKFKPARKTSSVTLWSVIEAMQHRLERQGLDVDAVDAKVTRRLSSLLLRQRIWPAGAAEA